MGNPEKEREAYEYGNGTWVAPPPTDDGPPPAYEPMHVYAPPRPASDNAGPSESSAGLPLGVGSTETVKFPKRCSIFFKMWTSTYWLGTSKEDLLFAMVPAKWKGPNVLKDGPDKDSPDLASSEKRTNKESAIRIYAHPGGEIKDTFQFYLEKSLESAQPFELTIGHRKEQFEWRTTHGNEIKELTGSNHTGGHKLVRMATKDAAYGCKRKERPLWYASDGAEILAIGTYQANLKKYNEGGDLFFIQSLGETFEIATAITYLRIWEMTIAAAQGLGSV